MRYFILIVSIVVGAIRELPLRAAGVTIQDATTFELQDGTSLKLPDGSILEVNNLGTFKAIGAGGTYNAVITHSEAGTYGVNISGTINCQYFTFEYMNASGVKINSNATITSFDNGKLTNGATGGTLLWLEYASDRTFSGIAFVNPPGNVTYNVKTVSDGVGQEDNGSYYFTNHPADDNYGGDQYDGVHASYSDRDPGDANNSATSQGWIVWEPPYATELISFDAQAGWEEVLLQWDSEVEINTKKYILERSLKEDDGFEPIKEVPAKGVCGTYSYLDEKVVPKMSYWYKLIAVDFDSSCESWGPVKATPKKCKVFTLALLQNIPNPFRRESVTLIEFSVPGKKPSKSKFLVSLAVYDLSGRRVCELMSGEYAPGWYSVRWEPERKARGIYFYRLEVGEKSLSKKLVVY